MPDREKVIEILEKAKTVIENWVPMFEQYNTPAGIDDAIVLLKEQEAEILQLRLAVELLKEYPQVICCKDCQWYDEKISFCDNCHLPREQTFFCADGRRAVK